MLNNFKTHQIIAVLCISVSERLQSLRLYDGVADADHTEIKLLPERKRHIVALSRQCLPFHRLEMAEILLKVHVYT